MSKVPQLCNPLILVLLPTWWGLLTGGARQMLLWCIKPLLLSKILNSLLLRPLNAPFKQTPRYWAAFSCRYRVLVTLTWLGTLLPLCRLLLLSLMLPVPPMISPPRLPKTTFLLKKDVLCRSSLQRSENMDFQPCSICKEWIRTLKNTAYRIHRRVFNSPVPIECYTKNNKREDSRQPFPNAPSER